MAYAYKTEPNLTTKRVYYIGTDTLYEGYQLDYDLDSVTAVDPATTSEAATVWGTGRFTKVQKPGTTYEAFAGYVHPRSNGFSDGPGWILIIPHEENAGKFINVWCKVNCSIGATYMGLTASQYYTTVCTNATGTSSKGALMVAAQTKNTSSVAGIVQCRLLSAAGAYIAAS